MKTIYMSCITALAMLAAATSCIKGDNTENTCGPIDVRLVVSDGNGTRVGSDNTDNDIRQLRVYAFNATGENVGYAEADDLADQSYIPITLSEGGNINFYVIANDKFGQSPKTGGEAVTDWSSLSKTQLESLQFDLSGFNGWSSTDDDDFVSPMTNCRYDEFGTEFTGKYQNDYATAVNVTRPTTGSLVIPVTVQHVLGRLRLMLNRDAQADQSVSIFVTGARLYHRPDAFRLYWGQTDAPDSYITFENNDETLVDEFIPKTETELTPQSAADTYDEIGRTYLAPNQYGSSDPDTYTAQKEDGTTTSNGLNETYRLVIDVVYRYTSGATVTDTSAQYTVYLPRVPRNTSIDVQGTLRGSVAITPTFNVITEAWEEKTMTIPDFE